MQHNILHHYRALQQISRHVQRASVEQTQATQKDLQFCRQAHAIRDRTRREIALDLHDGPVQQLIGLNYQVGALRRRAQSAAAIDDMASALADVQGEILTVVAQLRTLIGALRPPGFGEFGLAMAIEGAIARLRCEFAADLPTIELDVDPRAGSLPDPIALCLFFVCQEALRNAVAHAHASLVTVRLLVDDAAATLELSDNGRGFQQPVCLGALASAQHFGLAGIIERVFLQNGSLTIRSQPDCGTSLLVRIPICVVG